MRSSVCRKASVSPFAEWAECTNHTGSCHRDRLWSHTSDRGLESASHHYQQHMDKTAPEAV